jgi:hypothetical protein
MSVRVPLVVFLGACAVEPVVESNGSGGGGKADLPNDMMFEREHDGGGYATIARWYGARGHDLTFAPERLVVDWPMAMEETALLNRFGTPILWTGYGYFHTALDVYRMTNEQSDAIVAPVAGLAMPFDWWGTPGAAGWDYSSVIAIWDPESHVIAQLMHVAPAEKLRGITEPVAVERGEIVGALAAGLDSIEEGSRERLRHAHTDLVDGGRLVALNPAKLLPYRDGVAPSVVGAYLLDADAARQDRLVSGRLDVVLEVFDRDDDSARNFEAESIAYEIVDDQGRLLRAAPRCRFEHLFESVAEPYPFRALQLLDFGNARHQIGRGAWPSADVDDRERTFRYALTQFFVTPEGRCDVALDADGFIDVADDVTWIEIHASVFDPSDNETPVVTRLSR